MGEYRYWKKNFCETSLELCKSPNSYGLWCNIMDEERFQKIQERSKERLQLYGYVSKAPIPVARKFNAIVETEKKALPATFIVVKGKPKVEMLLGCLKIVNSIDKEDKTLIYL